MTAVIYDFGMNNGDDVEYYLLKGAKVVGVEANSGLCEQVRARFPDAIASGALDVLNVALSDAGDPALVSFYLHKTNHVLSQLPRPPDDLLAQFTEVRVPSRTPASIVSEHGEPLYVKVDVEHFDARVLRNLFANGIFPPEISAESHSAEIFALLVANGYRSFNLVEGASVATVYGETTIATPEGPRTFRFKPHSAGPFGEDVRGRWQDPDSFLYTLAATGLGWKDIHASKSIPAEPCPSGANLIARQLAGLARRTMRGLRTRVGV